jgi:pyridoxamine 5'-phosphate oxidase
MDDPESWKRKKLNNWQGMKLSRFNLNVMNLPAREISIREQISENNHSSLESIEKECWNMLLEGASKGKSAFHTFVLGTKGPGGIELRTLVLRKTEKTNRSLFSHTDIRSPKAAQIEENSICSLLFYDPIHRVQLRLDAEAILHHQSEASARLWKEANMSARKSYLSKKAPGEKLSMPDDGIPEHLRGKDPSPSESENGLQNFLVIEFRIQSIDWLQLNSKGHRRAKIQYDGNGFDASWVNP